MTTTVQFYHLLSTTRERAVPKLMEKALASGSKVLMLCESDASLKSMSDALWASNPNGFLPHGSAKEAHADQQPILLSTQESTANGADILCILDGRSPASLPNYSKVLDVFDGSDETSVANARQRWSAYKDQGYALQYVKQQPGGGWKIENEVKVA